MSEALDITAPESVKLRPEKSKLAAALGRFWPEVFVVALVLILWAPRLSGPIDLRWDAGVYYVLGTSLATGHGYRITSEPGWPEAVQYPPLLPAIVAMYQRALGSQDPAIVAPWLRISYAVLFVLYGLSVLVLARRFLQPIWALAATAICLLHMWTIFLSDLLFAEIPFALVSVVFALLVMNERLQSSRPFLRETVLFLLATAGFLLRTAGIVLLVAWIIEALARRRWRLASARVIFAIVPVLFWQVHVERVHRSEEYRHPAYSYQRAAYQHYNVTYFDNVRLLDPFKPEEGVAGTSALVSRVVTNLVKMPIFLGQGISAPEEYWRSALEIRPVSRVHLPMCVVLPPIILLGTLVIVGVTFFLRAGQWTLAALIVLSVGLMCLTPWPEEFNRYLVPVAPFLAIAAVVAAQRIMAMLHQSHRRVATFGQLSLAGLVVVAIAVEIRSDLRLFRDRVIKLEQASFPVVSTGEHFFHGTAWAAWEQAVGWLAAHAAAQDIVATTAPHQVYLRTGLHAVYPPFEPDAVRARHQLENVPVNYVIIDGFEYRDFSRRYALPAVKSDPLGWQPVYSIGGTIVFERVKKS